MKFAALIGVPAGHEQHSLVHTMWKYRFRMALQTNESPFEWICKRIGRFSTWRKACKEVMVDARSNLVFKEDADSVADIIFEEICTTEDDVQDLNGFLISGALMASSVLLTDVDKDTGSNSFFKHLLSTVAPSIPTHYQFDVVESWLANIHHCCENSSPETLRLFFKKFADHLNEHKALPANCPRSIQKTEAVDQLLGSRIQILHQGLLKCAAPGH